MLLLVYCVALLTGALLSQLADRTILSVAVLFLLVGFLAGPGMLGIVAAEHPQAELGWLAEVTLFGVLFTDGMRVGVRELRTAWRLPGSALLVGLPLTVVGNALAARWLVHLPWRQAFLVAAALGPTDPVLASAILGHTGVPVRLKHLLNIESGLNDGLVLPLVIALLRTGTPGGVHPAQLVEEVVIGIGLGVAIPWLVLRLEGTRFFGASERYRSLLAIALALTLYSVARTLGGNEFLAAFIGGATIATIHPALRSAFETLGETAVELAKLATLLVMGTILTPHRLGSVGGGAYLFAFAVLVLVRPAALSFLLVGRQLEWREWLVAVWFGPKGFASITYGILILQSRAAGAERVGQLIAIVVALSILAHSTTDVPAARLFRQRSNTAEQV